GGRKNSFAAGKFENGSHHCVRSRCKDSGPRRRGSPQVLIGCPKIKHRCSVARDCTFPVLDSPTGLTASVAFWNTTPVIPLARFCAGRYSVLHPGPAPVLSNRCL